MPRSRWLAIAVTAVLTVALAPPAAHGQMRQLVRANPPLSQILRSGWLRLQVSSGRVTAICASFGNISSTSSSSGGRSERLKMTTENGRASIDLEVSTPLDVFTFQLTQGDRLVMRKTPKPPPANTDEPAEPTPPVVEFNQVPGEALTLTIGEGAARQVLAGPSLWHLIVCHEEAGRKYLVPMLETVRPDWGLGRRLDDIDEELRRVAVAGELPDVARWTRLVDDLAHDHFSVRQAADRELRQAGPALLPFLEQLDQRRLDPEQQLRVQRIMTYLARDIDDDSVTQVVAWLSPDPAVWLALMSRSDPAVRALGAEQLARLLGGSVAFDPQGDAATRQRQIEQIRSRLPRP